MKLTAHIPADIKLGQKIPEATRFSIAQAEYERRTGKPYPFESIDYPRKNISVLPPTVALDWTTVAITAAIVLGALAGLYWWFSR